MPKSKSNHKEKDNKKDKTNVKSKSNDKDIAEKELLDNNDVFVSALHAFLPGMQDVRAEDLVPEKPRLVYPGRTNLKEVERDVIKRHVVDGATIAMIGIENQTQSDQNMAIRILEYSGVTSAMWSSEHDGKVPTPPLYTLVLYFGINSAWTHPKSLYQLWGLPDDAKIPGLFPNIEPLVIDIGGLSAEEIEAIDHPDLKAVAKYVSTYRNNPGVAPDIPDALVHFTDVLNLVVAINNFAKSPFDEKEIVKNLNKEEETMNQIIHLVSEEERRLIGLEKRNAWLKEGKEEGLKEGRVEGQEIARNSLDKILSFCRQYMHYEWVEEYHNSKLDADTFIQLKKKELSAS